MATTPLPVLDPVTAGPFSAWLQATLRSLSTGASMDVPCGDCVACCCSSQFIHIEVDEADARAHVPAALMFDAPGGPPGTKILGYNEQGLCPLLEDEACTVYAHRPRACRQYDCRVFAAAGLFPDSRPRVATRAQAWRFVHEDEAARAAHEAVQAAARFLREHPAAFSHPPPPSTLGVALVAIRAHHVFLQSDIATRSIKDIAAAIEQAARSA